MSTHNFYRKPGPIISKAERKAGEPLAYRVEIEVDPDPLPFRQHEDDDIDTQYGFIIHDTSGDSVESCWGFLSEEEALEAAKEYMV